MTLEAHLKRVREEIALIRENLKRNDLAKVNGSPMSEYDEASLRDELRMYFLTRDRLIEGIAARRLKLQNLTGVQE